MKKLFALFAALFVFCAVCAQAQEPGYISVSSEVTREVQPNFAQFNVTVEKFNTNQAKAIQENNEVMNKIITELKKKLGENNKNALNTTSFTVSPQYIYKDGKQTFDKYAARTTLRVNVDNLSQISELIEIALKNGATTVNGLNFSLKSTTSYCDDILKQATQENINKANAIASTLNMKVSSIKQINASCSQQTYYASAGVNKMLMSARAEGASFDSAAPAVEKDMIKIHAHVSAEFWVK